MEYQKTVLDDSLLIDGLYTVHYFEYAKDFVYAGEKHNFWELVYADKKRLFVTAETEEVVLEAGDLYLHRPNEFHTIRCDGQRAANSFIVSFDCKCAALFRIAGQVIRCGNDERRLISAIIRESHDAFTTKLGTPRTRVMEKSRGGQFGCEQLIRLNLELLLISLVRNRTPRQTQPIVENRKLFADICAFMDARVTTRLTFSDITHEFSVSPSVVKGLFRREMGCGTMEYFTTRKIERAKQLIRESNATFTEIAAALSFNSSQYFTTVFSRVVGMTPSEYARSVVKN